MASKKSTPIANVALPWSNGLLSARLWKSGNRTVVGVPELGLHCYGNSQSEAVFRLFTTLLKYYRQLRNYPERLGDTGRRHLQLLGKWVEGIEQKMMAKPISVLRPNNR
jgi:hypothetical protein